MDCKSLYLEKLCTPEEAVRAVKSGDWVDYGWCTNHPLALDKALAARKDELHDVKVRGRRDHGCRRSARRTTPVSTSPGTPGI